MFVNQHLIKYETYDYDRIQVNEFQLWNQTDVKFRILFLNKKITDGTDSYYKLCIWPQTKRKKLTDFLFSLQLKTNSGLQTIQADISSDFDINDNNPIIFKIPSGYIQDNLSFFYDFTHDILEGKGEIDINLSLTNEQEINNELIMYDDGQNIPLINKKIVWDIPDFALYKKYRTIASFKIEIDDLNLWKFSNIKLISEMGEIVKNDILDSEMTVNSFNLKIVNDEAAKYYDFTPNLEIIKNDQQFNVNINNCMELNSTTNIVEDSGTEKGFVFNPNCLEQQQITLGINVDSTICEKTIYFVPGKISYLVFDDDDLISYKLEIIKK